MKNKIYKSMFSLMCVSLLLVVITMMFIFHSFFNRQTEWQVKNQALLLESIINNYNDNTNIINYLKQFDNNLRVTIIAEDGQVVLDTFKDTNQMENHIERPEVKEAFEKGNGQGSRFSNTLKEQTFYYAIKLKDNTVLRLAKTTNSITAVFFNTLPAIFGCLVFIFVSLNLQAIKLTKKIIYPINNIDLSNPTDDLYEELSPFVETIKIQKKHINEQLKDIEDRTNTIKIITDNMKEGILLIDKNSSIILINNSVLDLFDSKQNDYIGKNILEFVRNKDLQAGIKKAIIGDNTDLIIKHENKTIHVFLNPVITNNNVNGVAILFLNVTEKAKAEKMRQEFSANVSHELKTPLTTIVGFSEIINSDMAKPDDVRKFSGKIKDESIRLIALIQDIIKISELDEDYISKNFVSLNLKLVLLEVVKSLSHVADSKNISIKLIGDKKIINANNQMIFEMFYNIIDNAIKYNKPNGSITIKLKTENNKITVEISDTGIGIQEKHLDRVFERFYRVDKSRSKKTGGTGLGLSIVKHIAEYHGGSAEIESELGIGTKLIIKL